MDTKPSSEANREKTAALTPWQFRAFLILALCVVFVSGPVRDAIGRSAFRITYATAQVIGDTARNGVASVFAFFADCVVPPEPPKANKPTKLVVNVGGKNVEMEIPAK